MGLKVLVTSPALLGHLNPMVPVAQAMAARGHSVLWALPADGVEEVERRGLRAVAATPAVPFGPALAVQRYPELGAMAPDRAPEVMFGKLWGAIFSAAMLDGLVPTALDWRPDLVIADAADFSGHILAAELGVPSITKGFGPLLPEVRVAAAGRDVAPLWRSRGLEPRPYGGAYDTLYLDIYPPRLHIGPADHVPRRQPVRPHSDNGDVGDSSELPLPPSRSGAPLVYVTMGTVFNDPQRLRPVVDALADLPVRVLVTVGPRADPSALGPQGDHVRVERYVPQSALLQHCDVVVSHAGSGTVLASLALGIPQLCLPQGADQFLNAAAIAAAGAGLSIPPEQITSDAVAEAVSRLLADASFRRAVRQSIDSMPTAADVAPTLEALA
jgi:UDP:flavonoid glycosyltransferase YjiC (YdhE family)